MSTWFVPRDSAARSVGADDVARALRDRGDEVIRTGSRGMLWMEPLVEAWSADGEARVGWSNVTPEQVADQELSDRSANFLGPVREVEYFARQDRWIFGRVGEIEIGRAHV